MTLATGKRLRGRMFGKKADKPDAAPQSDREDWCPNCKRQKQVKSRIMQYRRWQDWYRCCGKNA